MKTFRWLIPLLFITACAPRAIDVQYAIVDSPCAKFINIGDRDLCMHDFYQGASL